MPSWKCECGLVNQPPRIRCRGCNGIMPVSDPPPIYLYVEALGFSGMFHGPPGNNSWTDEAEWAEIERGDLKVFRFESGVCSQLQRNGEWEPVREWYRT